MLLSVLAVLFLGNGCIATVPHGTPEVLAAGAQHFPGLTELEVEQDRALFLEHCTGCHLLPTGKRLAVEEWPDALEEMNQELVLATEDVSQILRYLQLSRLYWEAEQKRRESERQQRRNGKKPPPEPHVPTAAVWHSNPPPPPAGSDSVPTCAASRLALPR